MLLNRTELKKVQYDFICISNRLLRAACDDYLNILGKLLVFIKSSPPIFDYLVGCGNPTMDIEPEVKAISSSYGRKIFGNLGDTEQEEDANIYGILKYVVDNGIQVQYGLAFGYSSSTKYHDKLKGFNERVVMVMIRHIDAYLTKIGIDMGLDETVKYNITNNNGQVIVANDNATINATLNNGVNHEQLKSLLDNVLTSRSGLNDDDMATVAESAELIENELKQLKPRRSILKNILSGLSAIKGTAEFGAAVVALVQFVQPLLAQ